MSNRDPNEFFALTHPCGNCPFRSDKPSFLTPERAEGIASDLLKGDTFVCHKTLEYDCDDNGDEYTDQSAARMCAGARATLDRHAQSNSYTSPVVQSEQVALRLGFDFPHVADDVAVYDSFDEWIDAQEG